MYVIVMIAVHNKIGDEGLQCIWKASLPKLKVLGISGTGITKAGLSKILQFPNQFSKTLKNLCISTSLPFIYHRPQQNRQHRNKIINKTITTTVIITVHM